MAAKSMQFVSFRTVCGCMCARLRLIYKHKQPFRTRSTQNGSFFSPTCSVYADMPGNRALRSEINKWNRLALVFMVCLELLLIAVVLVTVACYCFSRKNFRTFCKMQHQIIDTYFYVSIWFVLFVMFFVTPNINSVSLR